MSTKMIYGRRAVLEALRSGLAVEKVFIAQGGQGSILGEVRAEAEARHVVVELLPRHRFSRLAGNAVHQGIAAVVAPRRVLDLTELLQEVRPVNAGSLVVVTDEIEDPRNLGAIARCAEGAGAAGLIITQRRSADLTPSADKASAGALEHLPVARVGNLAQALTELRNAGFWLAGLDAGPGAQEIWNADLHRALALVIGGEEKGLRRLTRESCDLLLRIPMQGRIGSLNASVAAGIALFEHVRQRRGRFSTLERP